MKFSELFGKKKKEELDAPAITPKKGAAKARAKKKQTSFGAALAEVAEARKRRAKQIQDVKRQSKVTDSQGGGGDQE